MAICTVTGKVVNGIEAPIAGAKVYALPAVTETTMADGRLVAQSPTYVVTTSTGDFSLPLVQGMQVNIIIRETGLYETITVPTVSTATLPSLLGISDTEDAGTTPTTGETNW